jgi:hypothetical protein
MTLYQVLRELQIVLAVILGACPLCSRPVAIDGLEAAPQQPNKVLLGVSGSPDGADGAVRSDAE